jgi:hypothetical protein
MSEKLTALVVNAQTGEITEIALSAEEIAEREELAAQDALLLAQGQARVTARESALAKLAKLGLTQAEIDAL